MTERLLARALDRRNTGRPPVWLMRQAGRYHSHYQDLKRTHSFERLCKDPTLACEVALGPVAAFDFDAAILFSDILFPLEAMGFSLRYDPGPILGKKLLSLGDLDSVSGDGASLAGRLSFQPDAIRLTRARLSSEKGLLGFVGGLFTLYVYAVEGTHQGKLESARLGLRDGRWEGFLERAIPLLARSMADQWQAGADAVAIFDTAAGELGASEFSCTVAPAIGRLLASFAKLCPEGRVVYYSRGTTPAHWESLSELPIRGLGIDWRADLCGALTRFGERYSIQGGIDPEWLLLPWGELEPKLRSAWQKVRALPSESRAGWVCGLGHGVLQGTPEANVARFVRLAKEVFSA